MTAGMSFPSPKLQITFAFALKKIRSEYLQSALIDTFESIDIHVRDKQLSTYVSPKDLHTMSGYGIRPEFLFPIPLVLETNPRLIGYYRLLMGYSQKEFYSKKDGCGAGKLKSMEAKGSISKDVRLLIPDLCKAFCISASFLLKEIEPLDIKHDLLDNLALLTVGPQLRGGYNNVLGQAGIVRVFEIIKKIVKHAIVKESDKEMEIKSAAGRTFWIKFSSDPDIIILEQMSPKQIRNVVAIEVKSGTDASNIHNRIGEAEKSHQKAKRKKFTEFWTVVNVDQLDRKKAIEESPTTNIFYNLSALSKGEGDEYEDFKDRIIALSGISHP